MSSPDIEHRLLSLSAIRPNPWNPNRMDRFMYEKELNSIRAFGFLDPVTVMPDGASFIIIDGEHRWKAARELGYDEIPCTVVSGLTTEQAKQLTIVLNETRGTSDPKRLGDLLRDLAVSSDVHELLDLLPYSPEHFERMVGLADFSWKTEPATEIVEKKTAWVERTYRLPKEAADIVDDAISKARVREGVKEDWQAIELLAAEYLGGP